MSDPQPTPTFSECNDAARQLRALITEAQESIDPILDLLSDAQVIQLARQWQARTVAEPNIILTPVNP